MKKLMGILILTVVMMTQSFGQTVDVNINANGSSTIGIGTSNFYDSGGPAGNYSNYQDHVYTVYLTNCTTADISGTMQTESDYDFLTIFEGVGTNGTVLFAKTSGTQSIDISEITTPFTIQFTSDFSMVQSGYALTVAVSPQTFPTVYTNTPTSETVAGVTFNGGYCGFFPTIQGFEYQINGTPQTVNDTTFASPFSYLLDISTLNPSDIIEYRAFATAAGDTYYGQWKTVMNPAIYNQADLAELATYVNSGYDCKGQTFTLMNNIEWFQDDDWTAIGEFNTKQFAGTFDGNGKIISGFAIGNSTTPHTVGKAPSLFGYLAASGAVKNLGMKKVAIYQNAYPDRIGGLVRESSGLVENCFVTGTVKNAPFVGAVGGIVGQNLTGAMIRNCYFSGHAESGSANSTVGGIAGVHDGSIINCYATGTVVTMGAVPNGLVAAGLGFVNNSYWDSAPATSGGTPENGTAKKTATELKAVAPVLGLAFANDVTPNINNGYPILSWQMVTVTFNSNGGTTVSDLLVAVDKIFTAPTPPTKTEGCFNFAGWYKDNTTFANAWDFASDVVTSDITLFAKWVTTMEDLVNGDTYSMIPLAGRCWFRENSRATLYQNGQTIPFAKGYDSPFASDSVQNISDFGRLYDWNSVLANINENKICPDGWRVPTTEEWNTLNQFAADDLRSVDFWLHPNHNTNITQFDFRPAGFYNGFTQRFENIYGYNGYWLNDADSDNSDSVKGAVIQFGCDTLQIEPLRKTDGLSVRCIKVN